MQRSQSPTVFSERTRGIRPIDVSSSEVFSLRDSSQARRFPCDWLGDCKGAIERLLELAPDWDSYGAKKPDAVSADNAYDFISAIAFAGDVTKPLVTASPEGNVAFCWEWGNGGLDVEFFPNGAIEYAYVNDDDPSLDKEGVTLDFGDVATLLVEQSKTAARAER